MVRAVCISVFLITTCTHKTTYTSILLTHYSLLSAAADGTLTLLVLKPEYAGQPGQYNGRLCFRSLPRQTTSIYAIDSAGPASPCRPHMLFHVRWRGLPIYLAPVQQYQVWKRNLNAYIFPTPPPHPVIGENERGDTLSPERSVSMKSLSQNIMGPSFNRYIISTIQGIVFFTRDLSDPTVFITDHILTRVNGDNLYTKYFHLLLVVGNHCGHNFYQSRDPHIQRTGTQKVEFHYRTDVILCILTINAINVSSGMFSTHLRVGALRNYAQPRV